MHSTEEAASAAAASAAAAAAASAAAAATAETAAAAANREAALGLCLPGAVYRLLGDAATPMLLPYAVLPAAAAAAQAAATTAPPSSRCPVQKACYIGCSYRSSRKQPLQQQPEASLSCVYLLLLHIPSLRVWASSLEFSSGVLAAYFEADAAAAAADILAPAAAAAAAAAKEPHEHFALIWTCSAFLPVILEFAFDVNPKP